MGGFMDFLKSAGGAGTIGGITNLLGSLLGGLGKGQQEQQQMDFAKEMQQRGWDEESRRRQEVGQERQLGSTGFFNLGRNVPWKNYAYGKMLQGMMGDLFGEEKLGRYGIDIANIQQGSGFGDPFSQSWMGGGFASQPSPYGAPKRQDFGGISASGSTEAEPASKPARGRLMQRYGYRDEERST